MSTRKLANAHLYGLTVIVLMLQLFLAYHTGESGLSSAHKNYMHQLVYVHTKYDVNTVLYLKNYFVQCPKRHSCEKRRYFDLNVNSDSYNLVLKRDKIGYNIAVSCN